MRHLYFALLSSSLAACSSGGGPAGRTAEVTPPTLPSVAAAPAAVPMSPSTAAPSLACSSRPSPAPLYFINDSVSTCTAIQQLPVGRIESVEVLKGAAARAAYGAGAAAGVILVYTKPRA